MIELITTKITDIKSQTSIDIFFLFLFFKSTCSDEKQNTAEAGARGHENYCTFH